MFHLEIETSNAAFADDPAGEVARILRDLAERIEGYGVAPASAMSLRDANGNAVGEWSYTE